MGKKQKIKKKAAAAAAAAAARCNAFKVAEQATTAAAAVAQAKSELMLGNIENLMKMAKNLPSCSRKSCPSSNSGSSATGSLDSDDDPDPDPDADAAVSMPKCSRGEKKARRLLMKLDLQRIPNVTRVTMRKAKNMLLCIDQPEVYQCPNTKTLICFGEVRIDNAANAAAAQAAERYIYDGRGPQKQPDAKDQLNADANEDEDIDLEGLGDQLDEKDIELVQMQSGCTRASAIKALVKHSSDVVNAIMELTVGADV